MSYIYRELLNNLSAYFASNQTRGVILSGIVGCGKTTLVEKLLSHLSAQYEVFIFSGDDIQFRTRVAMDSLYLLNHIQSQTKKRALIFVDEVQKTEAVFDALKMAFDSKQCSFIVSGSNPSYLSSVAKKRLQRRAYQFYMLPLGISEILVANNLISESQQRLFQVFFQTFELIDLTHVNNVSLVYEIKSIVSQFLKYGGLPLSYLAATEVHKLMEIQLTVERGFELFKTANDSVSEKVKVELAHLQSQEFAYKNIMEKTRSRSRDFINSTIDELMNHGYVVKKKPLLLNKGKTSYLSVYSYVDPGITTYLHGQTPDEIELGFWLEGYIHSRLEYFVKNSSQKTELGYYKEHSIDIHGKTKFLGRGEIDFILTRGKKIVPIEVKLTDNLGQIDSTNIKNFIDKYNIPLGLILYGGVPHYEKKRKLLFWPYWLV